MLCLNRGIGESLVIDSDVVVRFDEVRRSVARMSISAPRDVRILRQEIIGHGPQQPGRGERLARILRIIGNNLTLDAEQTAAIRQLAGGGA